MIQKKTFIHPTSIVEKGAIVHEGAHIGPFCYIGSQVEIGSGTELKSHIVINGITKIGKNNVIYQFCSIGEVNQDLKYKGEFTRVEIGDSNLIRESVSIHRGTEQGEGVTCVGNHNLLMFNTHVAHDCLIGHHCILANSTTLGGHVEIHDHAVIGGLSAVHQFCKVGSYAMLAGCSAVVKHIPPFILAQGNHASLVGPNTVGLKRHFSEAKYKAILKAYQLLYKQGKSLEDAKLELAKLAELHPVVILLLNFLNQIDLNSDKNRGIVR